MRSGDYQDSEDQDDVVVAPLTSATWRVDRVMLVAKIIGVIAFAAIPQVFQFNLASRWFGAVVAIALIFYALRDVLAPVRLSADQQGVRVISGFASHRDIPWSQIERLRLDQRRRSGFLEIETEGSLHLLSRYDLSMTPAAALDLLERIRPEGAVRG